MSRRDRNRDSSLFPFLSVLACVIGTLTLLIAALAVGQVAEALLDQEELDASQMEELDRQREALAELEEQVAAVENLGEELAAARAELRSLGVDPNAGERELRRAVTTRAQAARLAQQVARLEARQQEISGNIRGVEAELRTDDPDSEDPPIRILPHGTAQPLRPFFVECRAEGVRVYSDDFRRSSYVARRNLDDAGRFSEFLRRVRNMRNSTVVFLIRPDGVETYDWASDRAERLRVRNAKLALPGQGGLDFLL